MIAAPGHSLFRSTTQKGARSERAKLEAAQAGAAPARGADGIAAAVTAAAEAATVSTAAAPKPLDVLGRAVVVRCLH